MDEPTNQGREKRVFVSALALGLAFSVEDLAVFESGYLRYHDYYITLPLLAIVLAATPILILSRSTRSWKEGAFAGFLVSPLVLLLAGPAFLIIHGLLLGQLLLMVEAFLPQWLLGGTVFGAIGGWLGGRRTRKNLSTARTVHQDEIQAHMVEAKTRNDLRKQKR